MNHYAFHIGDYIKDTAHLTDSEDLAYRRLLDLYYTLEGPLPLDVKSVCRRARIAQDVAEQIISEFFTQTADGFHHSRCDSELKAIYAKSESARISAELRWEKQRNANAMRTQCEGNATHNPLPITQLTTLSGKPDVVQLSNGKAKFKADAESILCFLNEKAGKRFPPTKANLDFVAGRLQEGATVAECRQVIAMKCREWMSDAENKKFLRPATLFNATKFSQYVGELGVSND